jgi:hypothetical protein
VDCLWVAPTGQFRAKFASWISTSSRPKEKYKIRVQYKKHYEFSVQKTRAVEDHKYNYRNKTEDPGEQVPEREEDRRAHQPARKTYDNKSSTEIRRTATQCRLRRQVHHGECTAAAAAAGAGPGC